MTHWIADVRTLDQGLADENASLKLREVGSGHQTPKLGHEVKVHSHVRCKDSAQKQLAERGTRR